MASYEVDSDEEAEQRLGESAGPNGSGSVVTVNNNLHTLEGDSSISNKGRYDDLLMELGLAGKIKHANDLPSKRQVSCYDVFCNRELKQGKLAAVGFDMDYTLAQYKQPAFDKLAFDGAKEKLVYKLGYPKEVLDFEYDHEVGRNTFERDDTGRRLTILGSPCGLLTFFLELALDTRFDY
jgi:hypothetical protein